MVDETSVLITPPNPRLREDHRTEGGENVRARGLGEMSKQNSVL